MIKSCRGNEGFTLVEFQVATWLGLLLLLLILTAFTWLLQQYKRVKVFNELQVNAVLAKEILHQQLRMAGFIGCPTAKDIAIVAKQLKFQPNWTNSIYGFAAGSQASKAYPLPQAKANSDVILSWFRATKTSQENPDGMSSDFILVSTCRHAKLIYSKAKQPLSDKVDSAPFYYYAYYIRSCGSKAQSCYGLYRKSLLQPDSPAQEIVSGISDMQASYGVKKPKTKLNFMPAGSVKDWAEVKLVKIELLLKSSEQVLTKPQRYWFNGGWHLANDRFLRRSLITYVSLRQR